MVRKPDKYWSFFGRTDKCWSLIKSKGKKLISTSVLRTRVHCVAMRYCDTFDQSLMLKK